MVTMHLLILTVLVIIAPLQVRSDRLHICQHDFRVKEGFYVYNTGCKDYDDDALAKAHFDEDRELVIQNGTIADIGALLNGSLYNITNLKIYNMAATGNTPITVFPIESMRFSILDLNNDGIERLEITENDYRLTHLDVRLNRLTSLENVGSLKKLQVLKADENALEEVSFDEFKDLVDLLVLNFKKNRITTVRASEEIALLKLRTLDLSENRLKTLDVSYWRFPELSTFALNDNALSRVEGLRGKFPKAWDIAMGGSNNWDCSWFDALLEFLKQDRRFALQFYGDVPTCPEQTRMEGFICCYNSTTTETGATAEVTTAAAADATSDIDT